MKFIGTDKKRFQIEIPEKVTPLKNFELTGSRKGFKRYYSPEAKVCRPPTRNEGYSVNKNLFIVGVACENTGSRKHQEGALVGHQQESFC